MNNTRPKRKTLTNNVLPQLTTLYGVAREPFSSHYPKKQGNENTLEELIGRIQQKSAGIRYGREDNQQRKKVLIALFNDLPSTENKPSESNSNANIKARASANLWKTLQALASNGPTKYNCTSESKKPYCAIYDGVFDRTVLNSITANDIPSNHGKAVLAAVQAVEEPNGEDIVAQQARALRTLFGPAQASAGEQ